MVDLTPEQQAARDAMIARRQPALTAEQQSARDAMLSRRPEPVGMAEAAVRLPVSSLTRGVSYLAGAPRAISDLAGAGGNYLMEKVGVPEVLRKTIGEGLAFANPLSGAPKAETMIKGASDLTGGFTDYEATTPGGKALGKAIEFAPAAIAAGVSGGASAIPQALTYGAAVPAVVGTGLKYAGDAIGRFMGDKNPEQIGDYAQFAGEILSPFGAAKIGPAMSRIPKTPQMADVAKDIDRLEKFGINVTPGSIRSNPDQVKAANLLELQNPKLGATIRAQGEQFSKGILRDAGVTDDLARMYGFKVISPMNADIVVGKHLDAVGSKIGSVYDNLISSGQPRPLMLENKGLGVSAQTQPLMLEDKRNPFIKALSKYDPTEVIAPSATQKNLGDATDMIDSQAMPVQPALSPNNTLNVNEIEDMASKIPNLAKYDGSLPPGEWIHGVRTEANQIMAGAHPTMGTSYKPQAKALIDYIDSKVFNAVGDVEFGRLQALNGEYSKLKTIQDALANSAAQGHPGIITPRSVISAGGTRHTKDINEISDLADKYLLNRGMIPTEENKKRVMRQIINTIVATGGAGVQGAMFGFGMDPVNAVKMGLAAAGAGVMSQGAQMASSAARGSRAAQSIARSRALYQGADPLKSASAPAIANIGDPRMGRKSGGRVENHDVEADQLVRAAERAKRGLSAHTEGLLNTPDDAVASALEVANRSI
jgi:hypothetical protein